MGVLTPEMLAVVEKFEYLDTDGQGFLDRSMFTEVLKEAMQLSTDQIQNLVEAALATGHRSGEVNYKDFFAWLADGVPAPASQVPDSVAIQLEEIAEHLISLASSLDLTDHMVASALKKHAAHLRVICLSTEEAAGDIAMVVSARSSTEHPEDHDPIAHIMQHHAKVSHVVTEEELCFRTKAAEVVQATGKEGELIDDLVEVQISEIKDKLAISYWRFCNGLKCWRSPTLTKALQLICSAPVPGLHGPSYLDVFKTLTQGSTWENHIFLFGGLVRDILRRTVGNDIDIGFSAPAAELEATCNSVGYKCMREHDYILIGDDTSEEFLEGMVISYNGIQPPEHADFSMNTLFYDFSNDIVIDKTGIGVPAVIANRCDLPCPPERWKSWIDINGVRVCFRYYKFLLRGYTWDEKEMLYVVETLIDFWDREPDHTIDVGRIALGGLVGCTSEKKISELRRIVIDSFDTISKSRAALYDAANAASRSGSKEHRRGSSASSRRGSKVLRRASISSICLEPGQGIDLAALQSLSEPISKTFDSAESWWQKGWLSLLKLVS